MNLIPIINTGSTSTKLAVYGYDNNICNSGELIEIEKTTITENDKPGDFKEDFNNRKNKIIEYFQKFIGSLDKYKIKAIGARGGLLKPLKGGVYKINKNMIDDLLSCKYGHHPSNMSAPIAYELAGIYKVESFIAYPVVTDEMDDIARYTGFPEIKRKSIFHALNQKSVARYVANSLGKDYKDLNLIVCHMGGGVSVGLHVNGRVVDVNNALDGEGPFTIERAGTLPAGDLVRYCFEESNSMDSVLTRIVSASGIVAYIGVKDARLIAEAIRNKTGINEISADVVIKVIDAFIYRVSKEICSLSAYTGGRIDAVVLTGGLANFEYIVKNIKSRVSFIGERFFVYPGENEMRALAEYTFLAITGKENILNYGR